MVSADQSSKSLEGPSAQRRRRFPYVASLQCVMSREESSHERGEAGRLAARNLPDVHTPGA